jgi:lipoate-protein ligase B
MPRSLTIYQLDTVGYEDALALQKRVMAEYAQSLEDAGTLILLEHPPILTIGRSGTAKNILVSAQELQRAGVRVVETNRGGDVTYHGPGQIVGYPILPLAFHGKDVHGYLRRLEAFLIATLWEYGIKAERKEGFTGVWTPTGKIASIGVAISHWISSHGFALNVAPNLEHFKLIHPCGLVGVQITSMEKILGCAPDRREVESRLIAHFCAEFGFETSRTISEITERRTIDDGR